VTQSAVRQCRRCGQHRAKVYTNPRIRLQSKAPPSKGLAMQVAAVFRMTWVKPTSKTAYLPSTIDIFIPAS
jgi:hypothetical protein